MHAFHRAFVFAVLFLDAVVLRVKFGHAIEFFFSDRIFVRRLRELDELLFVVNIRQRRTNRLLSEQPLQRSLAERAAGFLAGEEFS